METQIQQIPIFPLPGIVFFPNSILRLHVFEPRYREMTKDCLDNCGRMIVAQLKPGWEPTYYETPSIYRVAGLGRIVDHKSYGDGKYDITLEGIDRILIQDEVQQKPYRIATAETLCSCLISTDDIGKPISDLYKELTRSVERMVQLIPQMQPVYQKVLASHPHPGIIADLLTHFFVTDNYDKQCILEEQNVLRRIQLVNVQILRIIDQYSRSTFKDPI